MENLFIALTALLVGILLTWIIRKLAFEKNHINVIELKDVEAKLSEKEKDHAVVSQKFQSTTDAYEKLDKDYRELLLNHDDITVRYAKNEERIANLSRDKGTTEYQLSQKEIALEGKLKEIIDLTNRITHQDARLKYQTEVQVQYEQRLQNMDEVLSGKFEILANKILDTKSQKFTETQQKEMEILLAPLKTNLAEFKVQVEKTYKTENDDRISLREQVKHMMDLNQALSKEAKALTMALTGSTKKQGDWGELVLESILDYCGLQKEVHYFTQSSRKNEEGSRIRPDILVKYPDNRAVIIDSKVSLSHYEQLCREDESTAQAVLVKRMLQSFRDHIDGLSAKNYTHITNSLDMVIMFLPVEAAYITALQNEPGLQQYAYKKNVLLVSPSNLTLAMKLIYDMWKRDSINKNAEAVADRAGKLYDKLASFVDNFDKIGSSIISLQKVYTDAHKQLTSGRGNVLAQAEQMKQLEIKSGKQIPQKYIAEAMVNEPEQQGVDELINKILPNDS